MNLPSRYQRSLIAAVFGVVFLVAAHSFGVAADAAARDSFATFVNGCPAVAFTVAGTVGLIWSAIYAIVRS